MTILRFACFQVRIPRNSPPKIMKPEDYNTDIENSKTVSPASVRTSDPVYPPGGAIGSANHEPMRRKVSWGAVIAGTVVALAAMIVLGLLGLGIGLWSVEPGGEKDTVAGMATGTVIWSVISMLLSLFAGGYVAARMSASWERQNAVLHGVLVWAVATIFMIWGATSAISTVFRTAAGALGSISSGIASMAEKAIPDQMPEINLPDVEMRDLPPELQQTLRRQGMTAENFKRESREAFRNVISKQEQARLRDAATNTAQDILRSPGDAISDIESRIDSLVGQGGVISTEDRTELMQVLENRLGITEAEAEQMAARWEKQAKQVYADAEQALADARKKAIDAGDTMTDAVGKAAIVTMFGLLLGAAAAAGGAAIGRREHPYEDDEWETRHREAV
jgi:predicted nucleic acid-binding protein